MLNFESVTNVVEKVLFALCTSCMTLGMNHETKSVTTICKGRLKTCEYRTLTYVKRVTVFAETLIAFVSSKNDCYSKRKRKESIFKISKLSNVRQENYKRQDKNILLLGKNGKRQTCSN